MNDTKNNNNNDQVFTVSHCVAYEGSTLVGIFTNENAAQNQAEISAKDYLCEVGYIDDAADWVEVKAVSLNVEIS